ncbi:MAG: ABC transporter substrate-binding protein [Alphaproteobacteria bacterium]|nr:ABC transporter substrate-binding protein [Alphaproteobacteria bacterium]
MKSNKFLQVIISCIALFAVNVCYANTLTAQQALDFASTKGKELLMVFQEPNLETRYAQLDKMIMEYVDIDYISKFVVGKYWRQMTNEQKNRYSDVFVRYGLSFYKTLPLEYAKNLAYEIKNAEADGKFVNVVANINIKLGEESQNIMLTFRLHKVDEKIKVVDVKVAESSLLLSYRGKFYEMIAQSDGEIDWFLEDLEDLTYSYELALKQNVVNQQNSLEFDK